jgi:hypothetical protein
MHKKQKLFRIFWTIIVVLVALATLTFLIAPLFGNTI